MYVVARRAKATNGLPDTAMLWLAQQQQTAVVLYTQQSTAYIPQAPTRYPLKTAFQNSTTAVTTERRVSVLRRAALEPPRKNYLLKH